MRKTILNTIAFILTSVILLSCDHVKDVRDPDFTIAGGNRKVLVEDYTGHKCGNCPAAADTLGYLKHTYSGRVIPLAIHAGFFATINGSYPTDFRTSEGNSYDNQFGISAAGNPNGLINRVGYGTGGFVKAYTVWESEVVQMLAKPAKFELRIKNTFTPAGNNLNTSITIKSLGNNLGNYKLVVLLSEDSIIAEQLDYRLPAGSQVIPDYEFNHVLRGAINSTWGDAVFAGGAASNDSIVKSFNNFTINSAFNPAKCHVIAYIYDADSNSPTYYEVLQVEEAKVK